MYSACFLNDFSQIFIITSHYKGEGNTKPIKIFDLKGNKIQEINDSKNKKTIIIDNYYDKISSKNYIITGNVDCSISYDYNENKLYNNYNDNNKFHSGIMSLCLFHVME